ncbi:MAG: succinate dehydrogenase assembly factor 2 [Candidatus Accumulibacter sp.]|jgi:succinate dehydrogenase flavin-adding protein (antitoxin of CptAB toxin-antitoxin module)|nr:succinate dehydrogenase assembly factor 2 [Accumulibacter sp.]
MRSVGFPQAAQAMDATAKMNRLRWRCACRPLHEIDTLLGDFLEMDFPGLTPEQREEFAALAEMEDDALWAIIAGRTPCRDALQAEVVSMLRCARIARRGGV